METNENMQPMAVQTQNEQMQTAERTKMETVVAEQTGTNEPDVTVAQTGALQPGAAKNALAAIQDEEEEREIEEYKKNLALSKTPESEKQAFEEMKQQLRMPGNKGRGLHLVSGMLDKKPLPAPQEHDDENLNDQMAEACRLKIEASLQDLLLKGIKPTITRISNNTGLTRRTVRKHLESIQKQNRANTTDVAMFKSMNGLVLMGILKDAIRGDRDAVKLYAKIMEQMEKRDTTINNRISVKNANIQYNNYRITPEMVKKLPDVQQVELENILHALAKEN